MSGAGVVMRRLCLAEFYRSPLTAHAVEVWVIGELYALPGDAGSGKGFVLLKNGEGKVLEKKDVDLVIQIDVPRWFKDRVEVPLFADWILTGR